MAKKKLATVRRPPVPRPPAEEPVWSLERVRSRRQARDLTDHYGGILRVETALDNAAHYWGVVLCVEAKHTQKAKPGHPVRVPCPKCKQAAHAAIRRLYSQR